MQSGLIETTVPERPSVCQTWYRGTECVCLWKVLYMEEKFAQASKETMSSDSTPCDQM